MGWKKSTKLIIPLIVLLVSVSLAFAEHKAEVDLTPEWSEGGEMEDYTFEVCNVEDSDRINEVRIFANPNYDDFECEEKSGWRLVFVEDFTNPPFGPDVDMCWYTAETGVYIDDGDCDTFDFSAEVPESGCEETWYIETRDRQTGEQGNFETWSDTTGVDDEVPEIDKTLNGKKHGDCPPESSSDECWITTDTEIFVDVVDQSECDTPSGVDYCEVVVRVDGNLTDEYTLNAVDGEIHEGIFFQCDSRHELTLRCYDNAGNMVEDVEEFRVDTTPPETQKTYDEPFYTDGTFDYIAPDSRVFLRAVDGGPICAIDDSKTYYRVCQSDCYDEDGQVGECPDDCCDCEGDPWIQYDGPFTIGEDSEHCIEFYSVDKLGNKEETKSQCIFVDNSTPEIYKEYGEPFVKRAVDGMLCEEGDERCHKAYMKWINFQTPINISAKDVEPHPSGIAELKYRVTLADDKYCYNTKGWYCRNAEGDGDWEVVDNYEEGDWHTFNIEEESCHLIEIEATDNTGSKATHQQCVFVDNTPPESVKVVGEPKTMWDGEDANFYNISDKCWGNESDSIHCWEVTKTTTINLTCEDPEPHPVDDSTLCFQVEFDGDDITEKYCHAQNERIEGGTKWDPHGLGYCCVPNQVKHFQFMEESEHNLKYHCIDALGNHEELNEQKYKVTGTNLQIPLYKKWNLISVPFTLINDDPEEVFDDLENVDSVWTYDSVAGEWLKWSPGAPNNLDSIDPGWGYWVLMQDDEMLKIGGGLMEPAKLPPSKELVPGWNLIGYYGVSWELYPYMADYKYECGDYWNTEERLVYGDKAYCALSSLIDTQEGHPRWSSIWSYLNCGGHNAAWLGLNSCASEGIQAELDRMYVGRGYWVEMDVADTYAPATTCLWNDDYACQWSGGGLKP